MRGGQLRLAHFKCCSCTAVTRTADSFAVHARLSRRIDNSTSRPRVNYGTSGACKLFLFAWIIRYSSEHCDNRRHSLPLIIFTGIYRNDDHDHAWCVQFIIVRDYAMRIAILTR